ncbi:hypothetical protein [Clostridium saudiense]|uniref:hypothetical protein n=1 Tax=Clostridium saudiense TaxID=1414720 RepID=UPI0018A8AF80
METQKKHRKNTKEFQRKTNKNDKEYIKNVIRKKKNGKKEKNIKKKLPTIFISIQINIKIKRKIFTCYQKDTFYDD